MTNYLDDIKNEKFEVRLAKTEAEVVAAQKLRYKIFFEEDGAKPSEEVEKEKRDFDEFDLYCDHLIAIDKNAGNDPEHTDLCEKLGQKVLENGIHRLNLMLKNLMIMMVKYWSLAVPVCIRILDQKLLCKCFGMDWLHICLILI